ncbi:hypothetical protein GCM10009670_12360 [Citricoccus alkalitolerans]
MGFFLFRPRPSVLHLQRAVQDLERAASELDSAKQAFIDATPKPVAKMSWWWGVATFAVFGGAIILMGHVLGGVPPILGINLGYEAAGAWLGLPFAFVGIMAAIFDIFHTQAPHRVPAVLPKLVLYVAALVGLIQLVVAAILGEA